MFRLNVLGNQQKSYVDLIGLYQEDRFSEFYTSRHPKILEFILEAMRVFVVQHFV
ncbi:MAG: hypothetical protein K0U24_05380 [Gammaproteobacteria bacterium]|nr:hypothetical protein [Gammaproteobacteria bacterium]MCH9763650.1 hypothetical protein [Gammaproteobacteria bacterium]